MGYRIDPTRPPSAEARRVAAEQLARAARAIDDDPDAGDPETVHRVRVCCKRVRAVYRLSRGVLGDAFKAEDKAIARIARSLAAARDAQVVLDAFDAIVSRADAPPSLGVVRQTLDAQRDLEAAGAGDPACALGEARPALQHAAERLDALPFDALHAEHLWDEFSRTYRRARKAMSSALADPEPCHSHEWRTWAKRHWYHVRLLRSASPKAMRTRSDRLERLTERLGRRHDIDMLRARLTDPDGPLHALDAADWVLARADKAAGRLTLKSAREGLAMFSDKPKALAAPLASKWARTARRG